MEGALSVGLLFRNFSGRVLVTWFLVLLENVLWALLNAQTELQVPILEQRRLESLVGHLRKPRRSEVRLSDTEAVLYGAGTFDDCQRMARDLRRHVRLRPRQRVDLRDDPDDHGGRDLRDSQLFLGVRGVEYRVAHRAPGVVEPRRNPRSAESEVRR